MSTEIESIDGPGSVRMRVGEGHGALSFEARLEEEAAPRTCGAFVARLPFRSKLIHVRWSGEAAWVPLGTLDLGVSTENATSHPSPGEILLYPGGLSETEILIPYGATMFSSRVGQLAGNHFMTIIQGTQYLREMGRRVLWEGAQDIVIEISDSGAI